MPCHAAPWLSYPYWQSQMAGREPGPDLKLVANNDLVEIVGVTPPEFFGMSVGDNFDIALPFCQPKDELRRDIFEVSVMGRLQAGRDAGQRASAEMQSLSPGIFEATVPPGRDPRSAETYKHFRLAAYPAAQGVSWLRESYDSSALAAAGDHRPGAADRVRQPGQPDAGARQHPRARTGRAPGPGSVARPPGAAVARRKRIAGRGRDRPGNRSRAALLSGVLVWAISDRRFVRQSEYRHGLAGASVRRRRGHPDMRRFRRPARAARRPGAAGRRHEGRRTWHDRRAGERFSLCSA